MDNIAQCFDLSVSFISTIDAKTYVVSSSAFTTEAFAFNAIVNCGTASLNVFYETNNSTIPKPSWLTYNSAYKTFTYFIPTDDT